MKTNFIELKMDGVGHVENPDEKVSPVEDDSTTTPNAQGEPIPTEDKE